MNLLKPKKRPLADAERGIECLKARLAVAYTAVSGKQKEYLR